MYRKLYSVVNSPESEELDMVKKMGRPKSTKKVRLVEVRADEAWYAKTKAEADRLGLPVSTFMRVAVNEWIERRSGQTQAPGKA
jgi:hypothetical protein